MAYKGIIFDLDGTLLNSLVDIAEAVNLVLEKHHYPQWTFEDYKKMIGTGLKNLVKKALPNNLSDNEFLQIFREINTEYSRRQTNHSYPYDGILPMLKHFENKGVLMAILSNKPHHFTQTIVRHFFGDIRFEKVFGLRDNKPRKPNPETALEIIQDFRLSPKEVVFIGDSATDIQTAKNAHLSSIGVLWGYRSQEELEYAGADYLAKTPAEIEAIVES